MANGDTYAAKWRDGVADRLTPAALTEAKQLAARYVQIPTALIAAFELSGITLPLPKDLDKQMAQCLINDSVHLNRR